MAILRYGEAAEETQSEMRECPRYDYTVQKWVKGHDHAHLDGAGGRGYCQEEYLLGCNPVLATVPDPCYVIDKAGCV